MELMCPLCGNPLTRQERAWVCENRHSFDIARQGYVNLLPVQQKRSLQPGDTKEQVASRRAFLDGGFYAPIREELCRIAKDHGCAGPILDIGCGEGYYSAHLAKELSVALQARREFAHHCVVQLAYKAALFCVCQFAPGVVFNAQCWIG